MRSIRRFTQIVLTVFGGALVIFAVYRMESVYERVMLTALGLLVMELGIWQVTNAFFPNEREFKPLRQETYYFLKMVRRMNGLALQAEAGSELASEELDRIQQDMHHSVDRMRTLAGRTEEDLGFAGSGYAYAGAEAKRSVMMPFAWARRKAVR